MRALLSVFILCSLGCTGPRSRVDEEALQAELDREIASCRCLIAISDGTARDIPCGTTLCLGTRPIRCGLDATWTELETSCESYDADRLINGACRQDYPGSYPVDCASIVDPEECASYGGCFFEPAPCTEASYGCEGFITSSP